MRINTVNILNVPVSAVNMRECIAQINTWIRHKHRAYVCVTGVHGIMECRRHEQVRSVHHSANLVVPDGMPLVYISRLAGHKNTGRVYGPDLLSELCRESLVHGYNHFFFGTTAHTLARLKDRLIRDFPGIQISGVCAPPFRPLTTDETEETVSRINACAPDIVWVGMSTPKQECWMAENRKALSAPVLIGVGAAFDFHAGNVPQAPRWMQPLCLEWLFRLFMEPRRLWKRYLFNNPLFLFLVTLQSLKLKKYKPQADT
jgi:N-acetylglucosaminyldiphosphoundecaprenol N-acetyl-beta-D-mannosaminyltransferase